MVNFGLEWAIWVYPQLWVTPFLLCMANRMDTNHPCMENCQKGEFSLKEIENETQILGSVKIDQIAWTS